MRIPPKTLLEKTETRDAVERKPLKNPTYERRRAKGLCMNCGKNKADPNKTRCSQCAKGHVKRTTLLVKYRKDKGLCWKCGHPRMAPYVACATCLKKMRKKQPAAGRRWREKAKKEAFLAYGGAKCHCCELTEPSVLTLDHIRGGGYEHEKRLGSLGAVLYSHLRAKKFPPGYQVLCINCNVAKHRNKGFCPIHSKWLTDTKIR